MSDVSGRSRADVRNTLTSMVEVGEAFLDGIPESSSRGFRAKLTGGSAVAQFAISDYQSHINRPLCSPRQPMDVRELRELNLFGLERRRTIPIVSPAEDDSRVTRRALPQLVADIPDYEWARRRPESLTLIETQPAILKKRPVSLPHLPYFGLFGRPRDVEPMRPQSDRVFILNVRDNTGSGKSLELFAFTPDGLVFSSLPKFLGSLDPLERAHNHLQLVNQQLLGGS